MNRHNNDILIVGKTSPTGVQQSTIIIYSKISFEFTFTTTLPLNQECILLPKSSTLLVKSSSLDHHRRLQSSSCRSLISDIYRIYPLQEFSMMDRSDRCRFITIGVCICLQSIIQNVFRISTRYFSFHKENIIRCLPHLYT